MKSVNFGQFRHFLQGEFERRTVTNCNYSLRAYARDLSIHPSCLSVILRGKRPLTNKLVNRFVNALDLSPSEVTKFRQSDDSEYQMLEIDHFSLLSDWKHDAILELIKCSNFVPTVQYVAKTLEISSSEAQIAIERLERLNLISTKGKRWETIHENTELQVNDYTTAALKKFQKTSLERSINAIDNVDVKNRYHASMTMAIDANLIDEAREDLRKFRLKFCKKIQSTGSLNQVYQLNMSFYPLTKEEDNQ